jgi:hypothetical protein
MQQVILFEQLNSTPPALLSYAILRKKIAIFAPTRPGALRLPSVAC